MSISKNILRLRNENGWTQQQLADKINVTRATVTQWETGWTTPRIGSIQKLAGAFGVAVSDIIDDSNAIDPETLTPEETEMVSIMRNVTREGVSQLMIYARGVETTYPKNNQVSEDKTA